MDRAELDSKKIQSKADARTIRILKNQATTATKQAAKESKRRKDAETKVAEARSEVAETARTKRNLETKKELQKQIADLTKKLARNKETISDLKARNTELALQVPDQKEKDKTKKKNKQLDEKEPSAQAVFGKASKRKKKKKRGVFDFDSDDDDETDAALRKRWGGQGKKYPAEVIELGMTVMGHTMHASVVPPVIEACFRTCADLAHKPILAQLPIFQESTTQKIRTAMGWVATICGISKATLQSSLTMHLDLSSGSKNETLGSCILSFLGVSGSEGVTIGGAWEQPSKSADASAKDVIKQLKQALEWLTEFAALLTKKGLADPMIPPSDMATLQKLAGSLVALMGDHAFGQDATARQVMAKLGMEVVEAIQEIKMVHCWNHKIFNFQVLALEGEQEVVLTLTRAAAKSKRDTTESLLPTELTEDDKAALLEDEEIERQIEELKTQLSHKAGSKQIVEDLQVQMDKLQSRRKGGNVTSRFMYELAKIFSHLENISVWSFGKRFEDWVEQKEQQERYGDIWVSLKRHVGSRHHILYENAVAIYLLWETYQDFITTMIPTPHNQLVSSVLAALNDPVIKTAIRVRAVLFYDVWWPLRFLCNYSELELFILDGQQIAEVFEALVDQGCAGTSTVGSGAEVNLFQHCVTSMRPSTGKFTNEQKQAGFDEKLRLLKTVLQKRAFERVFHLSEEKHVDPKDDEAEGQFFQQILVAHFHGIAANEKKRLYNFLKEYRTGGELYNLTPAAAAKVANVVMTNDFDETLFGLEAMIKKYLTNAASWNVNSLIMWKYNRVPEWLEKLKPEVRSLLVLQGYDNVKKLVVEFQKEAAAIATEKGRLGKAVKAEEEKKWRLKLLKFLKTMFYVSLLPSFAALKEALQDAQGGPLPKAVQMAVLQKQCRYLKVRGVVVPPFSKKKVAVDPDQQTAAVGALLNKVAAREITLAPPVFKFGNERFRCLGEVHPALPSVLAAEEEAKAAQETIKNQILADLKEAKEEEDLRLAEKKVEKEAKRQATRAEEVATVQARIDEGKGTNLTFWRRCDTADCFKWRVISQQRNTKISNSKNGKFLCADVCQDKCSTACDACVFVPASCDCVKQALQAAKKQSKNKKRKGTAD